MSERAPSRRAPQAAPPAPPEVVMTIGELLARLAPEFPDVTHSKVRFLEDRGLVSPQRTPSGYRKYTHADAERLRTVLRLQRDQYLPLRVIREHLDGLDAAPGDRAPAAPEAEDGPPVGEQPAVDGRPDGPGEAERVELAPVARAEVLAAAGGSSGLVEALEDHGLLPRESAGRYPRSALELVRSAVALGEHGIEPRHLRALRTAVGAEAALVEQVLTPLRRGRAGERAGERAEEAERVAQELVGSLLALHSAALGCALDQVPPPS